jgi:hypothetical protein
MPNMSADDQLNTRKRRHDDSVAWVADLRERTVASEWGSRAAPGASPTLPVTSQQPDGGK